MPNLHPVCVQGCAFDKDNTLTLPFLKQVHPDIQASLDECKQVFGGNVVLFSNSAGLYQFDPDGVLQPSFMLATARGQKFTCAVSSVKVLNFVLPSEHGC